MEMKDIIEYVYYLDLNDMKYKVKSSKDCDFSYRNSYFKNNNTIIIGSKIVLNYESKDEIITKHHYYLKIRHEKCL